MANKNNLRSQGNQRRRKAVQRDGEMKKEYDFSVAERGKFYRADAEFHFPIYLDRDVNDFLTRLAEQKKSLSRIWSMSYYARRYTSSGAQKVSEARGADAASARRDRGSQQVGPCAIIITG